MRCEVSSCRAKRPRAWSLGATLLVLLAAPAARAQDCFPECRAGFVCANGACVSACNPPCGADERCEAGGACVVASPGPPASPDSPAGSRPHMHDGFFFRAGAGFGRAWGSVTNDPSMYGDVEVSSWAIPVELALGGTVAPGVVIGGGSYGAYLPKVRYVGDVRDPVDPQSEGANAMFYGEWAVVSSVGPFIAWYPNPARGLFVQAAPLFVAGSATQGYQSPQIYSPKRCQTDGDCYYYPTYPPKDVEGTGFGLMLGAGYDFWISDEWSVGGLVRVMYARFSDEADVSVLIPALLGTVTYH